MTEKEIREYVRSKIDWIIAYEPIADLQDYYSIIDEFAGNLINNPPSGLKAKP